MIEILPLHKTVYKFVNSSSLSLHAVSGNMYFGSKIIQIDIFHGL